MQIGKLAALCAIYALAGCDQAPDPARTAKEYATLKQAVVQVLCAPSTRSRAFAVARLTNLPEFQNSEDDVVAIGDEVGRQGCPAR